MNYKSAKLLYIKIFKEMDTVNVIDLNGTWTLNNLTNTTRFHDMPVTIPGSIVTGALENYEQALFKRSAAEAEESHELLDLCLGQDAPYGLIALFEGSNEQN